MCCVLVFDFRRILTQTQHAARSAAALGLLNFDARCLLRQVYGRLRLPLLPQFGLMQGRISASESDLYR